MRNERAKPRRTGPRTTLVAIVLDPLEPDLADGIASFFLGIPFGPVPFKASDLATHLIYEVIITNRSPNEIVIDRFEVLDDADRGRRLLLVEGDKVDNIMTLISGGADTRRLLPSQTGIIYVDVRLTSGAVPAILVHRIAGRDLDNDRPVTTVTGARVRVNSQITPPVLSPPAKGDNWVAAEACCGRSHHRRGPFSLNGTLYLSQRYAIDFIKMENGRIFNGDPSILSNWAVYGEELLAPADGVVTKVWDGEPDITPLEPLPHPVTKQNAAGNHVVVDMGNGLSFVYGHMQPNSIRVKEGDRVSRGEVLGLVENSGNTDAPHLHMHVMTGPDVFQGRGIPFVFDRFVLTGRFPSLDEFLPTPPGPPMNHESFPPTVVENAYPLELAVVNF